MATKRQSSKWLEAFNRVLRWQRLRGAEASTFYSFPS